MIALLITDVPFEQDIRELFMAFYPGEGYIYEDSLEAVIRFTAESRAFFGTGDRRGKMLRRPRRRRIRRRRRACTG